MWLYQQLRPGHGRGARTATPKHLMESSSLPCFTVQSLNSNNSVTAVNAITTYEQLSQHLEELVDLYANQSPLLQNSISHAYEVYKGIASIRTTSSLFTNTSFEPQLNKQVSISHRMLQQQLPVSLNQSTLGGTLLVSEHEVHSFRRFRRFIQMRKRMILMFVMSSQSCTTVCSMKNEVGAHGMSCEGF